MKEVEREAIEQSKFEEKIKQVRAELSRDVAVEFIKYVAKWQEVVLSGERINKGHGIINDEFYKVMFDRFMEEKYG